MCASAPSLLARRSRAERLQPIAATAVFFVVGLIGILHHEMWRDEIEVWMIATDSSSFSELLTNIRTQPHPPLWYVLTWLVARLTSDPRAIQVLSLLIGTATAWLFLGRAPFSPLQRVLFSFGYFPLYEYTIISRSYGLDLLFAVLFCALYAGSRHAAAGTGAEDRGPRRIAHPGRYPWLAATLVLLANVHLLGTVIAGLLFLLLVLDAVALARRRLAGWRVWSSLAVASVGIVYGLSEGLLGALSMGAEHMNRTSIDPKWLAEAVSSIYYAYLPIPDIFDRSFWNSNILALAPERVGIPIAVSLSVALVGLCAAALRRSLPLLALYGAGVLVMLAAFAEKASDYMRHYGHLAILFIALLWLSTVREPAPESATGSAAQPVSVPPTTNPAARAAALGMTSAASRLLTLALALHVAVAAFAYAVDYAYPFSRSADGARFLAQRGLGDAVLVGSVDYTTQPFAGYLGKSLYYPDQKRFATFMTWGPERQVVRYKQVLRDAAGLERETGKPVVLILDYDPRLGGPGGRCRVDEELELELLASFQCAIVHEESYWLALLRRGEVSQDPSALSAGVKVKPCVSPRYDSIGPEVEIPRQQPADAARLGRRRRAGPTGETAPPTPGANPLASAPDDDDLPERGREAARNRQAARSDRAARRRRQPTAEVGSWELHVRQGLKLAACATVSP